MNNIIGQDRVDLNSLSQLVNHGAKNINIETSDGQKVSIKSVGVPKEQSKRGMDGQMQTRGMQDMLGQSGSPLGEALSGLAARLGLSGGAPQSGKGAGMLNELAGFIANNFGRNEMGADHLGGQGRTPALPEMLKMASSMNGGAPTTPEQAAPPPIPAGAGMSGKAMGLLGPQGMGGRGGGGAPSGLAGLLGPLMSAAGQGAPQPGMPQGGPTGAPQGGPAGMPQGMPPQLAALLKIPGRAEGGPVSAGQPYVVGEKGPEVVVPDQSGTVIPNGETSDPSAIDAQIDTLIDEVLQIVEERGIPLLGPDGNMSPEALNVFIEVLQGKVAARGDGLDPMAEQIGGGPTPEPGADPLMGGIMSGAGGSNGAPMLDGLNSGAPAPAITGATPSGPDDIQALLSALGG